MITEKNLQEAIAECEGQRNPNANTCIMLAAFYTIKRELFGKVEQAQAIPAYSYAVSPQIATDQIEYSSDTEFSSIISDKYPADVWKIMDELMSTLQIVNPRLYDSVIRKLNQV